MVKPGPKDYDWTPLFLQAYEVSMNVTASAKAAGITRKMAYERIDRDAEFAEEVRQAKESALDALEMSALDRARKGKSDRMVEFLLRAHRPDPYDRPRHLRVGDPNGNPLGYDAGAALDARLEAILGQLESEDEEGSGAPD